MELIPMRPEIVQVGSMFWKTVGSPPSWRKRVTFKNFYPTVSGELAQ